MEKRETDQHPQESFFHALFHRLPKWGQRLVEKGSWHSAAVGYLVCLLLLGIALCAAYVEQRIGVPPYISGAPIAFVTIIVAWLWGIGPTVFAIVLGFILLDSFVIPPYGIFTFNNDWEDVLIYGPYILGELIVILIVARRERVQRRALATEREVCTQKKREIRLKNTFFSRASHELKTPLTSIQCQAQLASRRLARLEPTASELQSLRMSLEKINAQTHHLHVLINDLLDVSSLSSGKLPLQLTESNLGNLCREVITDQQAFSGRHIELELPSDPVILQVDSQRLTQVLINLVNNALKYSPKNSPVYVYMNYTSYHVIYTVRNTGHPIPQAHIPQKG